MDTQQMAATTALPATMLPLKADPIRGRDTKGRDTRDKAIGDRLRDLSPLAGVGPQRLNAIDGSVWSVAAPAHQFAS